AVGGDLQRADHHRADPARAARPDRARGAGGRHPAPQHAGVRRRRPDPAVPVHQADRPDPVGPGPGLAEVVIKETIRPASVSLLAFAVLWGFVYPLVMDGIAAAVFPHQATGSLIRDHDGRVVGSELIGQPFDNPAYFWSRLPAEANYDASSSTGTNLGPSSFVDDKGHLG